MSRSILITFFVVSLVMVNTNQTQGLTGILNRVRNNSISGKSRKTNSNWNLKYLLPVQVAMTELASAEPSSSSIPNLPSQTNSFFDADAYRQEMTDLVYQRNMKRMSSS